MNTSNADETCNLSGLGVYVPNGNKPWDDLRIKHFYRRFAFGATPTLVQQAKERNPTELIDELIDEAKAMPVTPDPGWGYLDRAEGVAYVGANTYWHLLRAEFIHMVFEDLRSDHIRARMTMFMHELFVSRREYNVPYVYQSYILKQKYAVGNFKDFIHDLGLDPAMIRYLNNYENIAGKPNENYARELYELFTLGVDNGYTEEDIRETARAFTGYNTVKTYRGVIEFNTENTFDDGEKTIFGRTGNWGYSDVIDILFEEKASLIANYICTKLYQYFVSYTPNENIIANLATTFVNSNFEFAPVLRRLFKSNHFFNPAAIGVLVKSPLDIVILHDNEVGYEIQKLAGIRNMHAIFPYSFLNNLEMDLLRPPNVSGWIKHKNWINSVSVGERISRMKYYSKLHNERVENAPQVYANFAKSMFDPTDDVATVARGIMDFCLSKKGVYEEEYQEAISVFKEGIPTNYFEDGTWNINYSDEDVSKQVRNLLNHIFTIPEFQLK